LLGFAVLLVLGLVFLRPNPVRFVEGQRSPGGSDLLGQEAPDGEEDFQVIASDPVVPTEAPAFATLPLWDGTIELVREINPRANLTGNVYTGSGGIAGGVDPLLAVQADAPEAMALAFLTPIINKDGQGFSGVNPPDTVGDAGPNHYVQMINGSGGTLVMIYDKNGVGVDGPWVLDTLGSSNCATGLGDPIVLYDQLADRWLLSEFSSSGDYNCVYISQGPDPVNDPWYAYAFQSPGFPDYPKYAVWPDAYYISTNESSPAVYALDRAQMLAGNAATSQRFTAPDLSGFGFQALTPGDLDGATSPPAGAPGYFMRHRDTEAHGPGGFPSEDFLEIWAFDVDFAVPGNSTFTQIGNISVAEFDSDLCGFFAFACFPQPGTGTTLDPLREVIMWRLAYRNFGSHEMLLGNLVTDVNGTDHGGVRWFELRKAGANPWSLYQEGTYAPDAHNRWMAAIAMDGQGNIAMGYNVVSSTLSPSLRYTGRLAGDPLGTMPQGEGTLINGTASNSSNRYGDYSAMSIDPADDCTFWFTGEYNAASTWSTRIGTFKFDSCGSGGGDPDINVNPTSLSSTQQANMVVNQTLTIGNVGTSTLNWDIDEDNSVSGSAARSGMAGATITIGDAGLTGSGLSPDAVSTGDTPLLGVAGAITLTHSTSNSIVTGSVACNYSGPPGGASDNAYLRVFDLSTYPQITGNFQVTNVQFGVESANSPGGTQPLTINLYTTASEPLLYANMTLIGTTNIQLPDQALTLVNVPVTGTATPSDLLVVEVFQPDTLNATATNMFIGSNALGQTDESYLASVGCGLTDPTDIAAIGFPNMHIVMSVSGDVSTAAACDAPEDIPWLSLSPASGTTAAGNSSDVTVTYDSTGLSVGTYNAALCINSDDPDESLVEVPVQLDVLIEYLAYLPIVTRDTGSAPQDVVQDGGFEAGTPNPFWNEASSNFGTPLCTAGSCGTGGGTGPHSGTWWAWFGGTPAQEVGSVDQDVTIPSGTATLSFWLEIPVADTSGFMNVEIDNNVVATFTQADQGAYATYVQVVLDVSAYADGGTHNLEFSSTTDAGAGVLNFFVDGVKLVVVP
jgi:hypothetical protein